jgi:hypothetical protein
MGRIYPPAVDDSSGTNRHTFWGRFARRIASLAEMVSVRQWVRRGANCAQDVTIRARGGRGEIHGGAGKIIGNFRNSGITLPRLFTPPR